MIGSVIRILAAFAAAFFTGKAVSRLKLPSILGWLIAGMVLGPHGVNLLDNALLNSGPYTAMTHIFECAVGLMIGTELVWKRIRKSIYCCLGRIRGCIPPVRHFPLPGFYLRKHCAGNGSGPGPFHCKGIQDQRSCYKHADSHGCPG